MNRQKCKKEGSNQRRYKTKTNVLEKKLTRNLSIELLTDFLIDGFKQFVVVIFFLLQVFFLVTGLLTIIQQDVSFDRVVENQLVNHVFSFEHTIFPGEFCQIVGSLGVLGRQDLENNLISLLGGEVFLVVSGHIGIVLVEEILIVLQIVIGDFFLDLFLNLFASAAHLLRWHDYVCSLSV